MDMSTDWRCWMGIADEEEEEEEEEEALATLEAAVAWWAPWLGGDGDIPLWLLGDGDTEPMEPIPVRRRERGRGTLSN